MPKGVYKRTPEMKTGIYKRTSEHGAAISKWKKGVPNSPEHNASISKALTGRTLSPEHCATMSAGKLGVPKPPRTPEHCAALSEGHKESEADKANADRMRGGLDLVTHHYIYDESDLSLNTIQMTRSDHTSLHMLLKKLGYIVPHINVKEI